jgi:hypothetical protein
MHNDRTDDRLRHQPLGYQVTVARIRAAWFRFQVMVKRDQRGRRQKCASLTDHCVGIPADAEWQRGIDLAKHRSEPLQAFGIIFQH